MKTKMCDTVYEILWVKIKKAVEFDSYRLPGTFQRTNASGRIVTIGVWVIPDTNIHILNKVVGCYYRTA